MTDFAPRKPQAEARAALTAKWRAGERRLAVVLPTGVGKTGLYLWILADALRKGHRAIVLAHRGELLEQPIRSLAKWWPDLADRAGIVKASENDAGADAVFASIQTVQNPARLASILANGAPRLIIVDEAHHSIAPTWIRVLEHVEEVAEREHGRKPLALALTATPERADGRELGDVWGLAYSYSMSRAIREGYLVPPRFVVERLRREDVDVDLSAYAHLDDEALGSALILDGIVSHTVRSMLEHAAGCKSVVFTASVEQARQTAEALEREGVKARYLTGKTRKTERARLLECLREGLIDSVVNCGVLTEGFDDPSLDAVILARPLTSKGLYLQCVGRGLRLHPGKTGCTILDLVGASEEHSLTSAGVLLADERRVSTGSSASAGLAGEINDADPLLGFLRERAPFSEWEWSHLRGYDRPVKGVDCGEVGALVALREGAGWLPVYVSERGEIQPLADEPVVGRVEGTRSPLDDLAADLARRASRLISSRQAPKYQRPPSLRQADRLARLGAASSPRSVGDAEALISLHRAAAHLERAGVLRRV